MAFVDYLGKPSFSSDFDCFRCAKISGEGGIRTLVTVSGKTVFETVAFNHSATSPVLANIALTPLNG
jgi:hypothetical protein